MGGGEADEPEWVKVHLARYRRCKGCGHANVWRNQFGYCDYPVLGEVGGVRACGHKCGEVK